MPTAVVIGLDGSAWHLLDPLVESGAMPRLAALKRSGAWGTLISTIPPVTPPAWTSAATGVNPGRHGIYGFHGGNAQVENPPLMHSGMVGAPTAWEIANAQGATMGVFNVPLTYPPQAVDGWMVAGMMTPGLGQHLTGFVYPAAIESRVRDWVPDYVIELSSNWEQDWRDASLGQRALDSVEQRAVVLERLLEEHPVDLVFAVLETPDRLQHMYYAYMDPSHPLYRSDEAHALRPTIVKCFEAMDRIVGLLVDYAGADGGVILCSDHGFTSWDYSVHTNALLKRWGLLELKPGAKAMQSRAVRALVPVAKRVLPTKVRRGAKRKTFSAIDWSRTKAFGSPDFLQGVFINLAGREPFGEVSASEAETLKEEISRRFLELTDPDGDLVTERVWRADEIFAGDARAGAPDLFPVLRGHRYELDDDLFFKEAFTDHRHLPRGVHHPEGVVVCAGRGVRRREGLAGSVMDVAPTLLYMAGLEIPEGLDGRPLDDAFAEDHVRAEPPRYTTPIVTRRRDEASPYSAEEEALIEESLRGLGYL